MEGAVNTRGRGFRPNGTSRPPSKNRQWIAPGQESPHASGSDSEKWERGGGPRRGGGRGRGRGRGIPPISSLPSSHLAVIPSREEPTNDTDDEGMTDVEDLERNVQEAEEAESEAQTPEEREKFYQELVKARDLERKKAIAEGKMDDPLVPKRLDEAITMVGTCMDMCPRFERYRRERENNLDKWEVIPGTKRVDHKRAVKIYERAAGDKTLPSDLRPPPVLKKTLDYLFHDLIMRGGFSQTYGFIRDRSRAVRSDFTMQHETGSLAMECHDRCARFHILALHLERDSSGFSVALEEQQLMNTLQSLKEFYEDQRGRYASPTELEMRVYHRLIHIRDQRERHEDIPDEILTHPVFQLTTKFRLHVQAKSAPITKNSTLIVDADGMEIFAKLASVLREQNNVVMIYLVACIMERLFGKDTIEDIEAIRGELTIPEIIDGISRPLPLLANDQDEDAVSVSDWDDGMFDNEESSAPVDFNGSHASGSTFVPNPSQPPFISQADPPVPGSAQSAFSNLVSTPNVFGSTSSVFQSSPSVFGGGVFGPPSSSFANANQQPTVPKPFALSNGSTPSILTRVQPQDTLATSTPAPDQTSLHSSGPILASAKAQSGNTVFGPVITQDQQAQSTVKPPRRGQSVQEAHPLPAHIAPAIPRASASASQLSSSFNIYSTTVRAPVQVVQSPEHTDVPLEHNNNTTSLDSDSSIKTQRQPRIIDRRQTLWDIPSTTPASLASIPSVITSTSESPAPLSPSNPPQLNKPTPLALPPTPTARWFDPSSLPKPKGASLALRKQSLGLINLQVPEAPTAAEILSPLTLTTPRDGMLPSSFPNDSPTPRTNTQDSSSSRRQGLGLSPSPTKGKAKQIDLDDNELALQFRRRGTVVQQCYKRWKNKLMEKASWLEACRRSDEYKDKIQRHRLTSSLGSIPGKVQDPPSRKRRLSATASSPSVVPRPRRPRKSAPNSFGVPVVDDALVKRLKENHEGHQRRWAPGSFVHCVRSTVNNRAERNLDSQWNLWVSMNSENDGTAIWIQRKFDIPASGDWISENVFSIPIASEFLAEPTEPPGLVVFELTPTDKLEDIIEKKYRILDDCRRLRDVMQQIQASQSPRYIPSLLLLKWTDENDRDVIPDFDDMVTAILTEGVAADVGSLVLSSDSTDWDEKFEHVLSELHLDLEDKATTSTSWKSLSDSYLHSFKASASDWLDSCWADDQFDWSRYGDVIRAIEDVQRALVQEVLDVLGRPSNLRPNNPKDIITASQLGASYATGPFLQALLDSCTSCIEQALGSESDSVHLVARDKVETSQLRFAHTLQNTSERLRRLAASALSRSPQKRPATEGSDSASPSSTAKRFKASMSPTASAWDLGPDVNSHEIHTLPPLSTAPSTTSELIPRPQVTIAMLRELTRGVLQAPR